MGNTKTSFDVHHNRFTLASSAHSHNTRFSKKKKNFITVRPRTRLGLNCFKYLGPKFWSSVSETFKNLKKDCFKFNYKNFLLNNYKYQIQSASVGMIGLC